jgi:hypothetical protein
MAGIGDQEYPELTPSEAISIAERVGRESVKTKSGLVAVMGLKDASGYFYHRVSALTKYYGLIDRSLTNVTLTPIGERIAHPLSEADKRAAMADAVGRVPLLRVLHEALGRNFHDADFRTKLKEVTHAPLSDIEKQGPFLEKVYRDAIQYLEAAPPAHSAPSGSGPVDPAGGEGKTTVSGGPTALAHPQGQSEPGYRIFTGTGVFLKVKEDPIALREALVTIQGWISLHEPGGTRPKSEKAR